LMGIVFYPRGGSAQVVRYLTRALRERGHDVTVVSGSLEGAAAGADARSFYSGLPLLEVDYTEAVKAFDAGRDPMSSKLAAPMPPSYEDKPGAPDRAFHRVGPKQLRALVTNWRGVLSHASERSSFQVLHLHHLNHLHSAALGQPYLRDAVKIAHFHGTELKMLEEMASGNAAGPWAALWREEMNRAVVGMDHFVAISPDIERRAVELLGLPEKSVSFIPNGVDTSIFRPNRVSAEVRMRLLDGLLVKSPKGWDESGVVGSVRYEQADLHTLGEQTDEPKALLLFAGRFLAFKRLPLLVEAVAKLVGACRRRGCEDPPFNLLVCGGVPGEWEGEHPHTTAQRLGLKNVFFTGWLDHVQLANVMGLADVFVAPSHHEPFGLVYLEAMATGIPVIATRSGGPVHFVTDEGPLANGWLCEVDDVDSLAAAVTHAMANAPERKRRGRNALELVRAKYRWSVIAGRFEELYMQLISGPAG
jgi:glycosyltransferase involved in cell wall biosynthesis